MNRHHLTNLVGALSCLAVIATAGVAFANHPSQRTAPVLVEQSTGPLPAAGWKELKPALAFREGVVTDNALVGLECSAGNIVVSLEDDEDSVVFAGCRVVQRVGLR